ncbi:MAG: DEAD/DEAH box helicase family protein [Desulfobulbaceae bacterium]|nr:DEAD/DEAH box helicase family protein [Desulfobulbaceae bacterium]
MVFDFTKVKVKKKDTMPVDPVELFQKIKVSDPNINDLWLAQGDALRAWHKNRAKRDLGVVLNTGAGKTLVGLLMAQSLVNETRGKILYACSSIQLVEQTEEKAKGYGLDVTTRVRGGYSNDLFLRGHAPCVTTYQALFNGYSVFFKEEINAIIFDDAHAAEHLLRDHFSVKITRTTFPSFYSAIAGLFKDYHHKVGKAGSYEELGDPSCRRLFLIPPFEVQRNFAELTRVLHEAKLSSEVETKFAWEHIKDHVDLCCLLITGSEITITPAFVPTLCLPYFGKKTRRIYLSATLSAPDAFARTFGKVPDEVIAPTTTAGECERLILIPARSNLEEEDVVVAKELLSVRKALILVPTYFRANKWEGLAIPPAREKVSDEVRAFKESVGTPKLLLAARYDGVDLPGDTCRVMAIDDLPMGVGPLERFMWENLNLSNTLRTAIASRVVQSFGRISRGLSDHGVVVLSGSRLVDWLLVPRNAATLPAFLQKQIQLGYEVSTRVETIDDLKAAMDQCLGRDKDWQDTYSDFIANAEPYDSEEDPEKLTRIAESEAQFGNYLWKRDYEAAAKSLASTLDDAFLLSANTGAWHCLWLGFALELLSDADSAIDLYLRAHTNQYKIPAYPRDLDKTEGEGIPSQIVKVYGVIKITSEGKITLPKNINSGLIPLDGSGTPAQTEEALRVLGQFLGLESSRPDKEFGTGPDVLWTSPGMPALCMEVKTDKGLESKYQKKEVGQLSDHVQWVKDNSEAKSIIPVFVGPVVGTTETANPPEDFFVISLDQFKVLSDRLVAALNDSANKALPITIQANLSKVFQERDLIWPGCFGGVEKHVLKDLSYPVLF